jgi:hypothetical protein
MRDEGAGAPPPQHAVTVRTDRVVTLSTTLRSAGSVHEATMQAERNHKDAWRRLAHQLGVTIGPVVDVRARGIMLAALRPIARDALVQIGDRSVAPLDDTDVR